MALGFRGKDAAFGGRGEMSGASYLAALSTPRPAAAAAWPGHAWDGSGDTRGTGAGTLVGPAEPLPRPQGKRPSRGRTAARGRRRQEIPKD